MKIYCPYSYIIVIMIASILSACASTEHKPGHYPPITSAGIVFEFGRCEKVARDVHCTFHMTADGRDTLLDIEGLSRLYDNNGKKYSARRNKTANKALEINAQIANRVKILANARTESLLIFYNFSETATQVSKLEIVFTVLSPIQSGRQIVVFNNIMI